MDEHKSEYLAPEDERLAFVSGFTGSAGHAVITAGSKGSKAKGAGAKGAGKGKGRS